MNDQTQPLRNGDLLPTHPDASTALKVVRYGRVYDDADGHELMAGLHRAEVTMLKQHEGDLGHLYRYAFVADAQGTRIFHTRPLVVVECECESVEL